MAIWQTIRNMDKYCCQIVLNIKRNSTSFILNSVFTSIFVIWLTTASYNDADDDNLDLASELKKLRNIKEMVIPIVIGVRGQVTKGLIQGWRTWKGEDKWRPANLKHYRILRRVMETSGDMLLHRLHLKTIS